jgi:hypothetical protein
MKFESVVIEANTVTEIIVESGKAYENPFMDVTLDAVVTAPDGATMRLPAFWTGGNRWAFRFASPHPGSYAWKLDASDTGNTGLHGVTGKIEIVPYRGENPLYRHGPIRVAGDKRHFEHADGTPFLWLADTWWKALSKRLTWKGFQELTADRKAKGFNTVQIVCGPYPDEEAFHPGWANEGGMMYEDRTYTRLNPKYFRYADRRLQLLVEAGLMPALVGAWGRSDCNAMKVAGVEGLKRHWRYLVARYAAYPLILIPGGEVPGEAKYGEGDWGAVVKYLCEIDPYKRIKSSHEYAVPAREDTPLNDFELVGGSHLSPKSAETLSVFTKRYAEQPTMPLVCGETGYEGHMQRHFADTQRYVFWMYMLNGAAGHTYGAAGLHHMGVEGDPGLKPIWDYTTWQQAKDFPGATQVGIGRKLMEQYPWHRFEPHPEWTDPDGFAAGIPGEVRFIFRANRSVYDWTGPRVRVLEEGSVYKAYYFDPVTGRRFDQGIFRKAADHAVPFAGHTQPLLLADETGEGEAWELLGKATRSRRVSVGVATDKGEESACPINRVSVHQSINRKDVMVSVEAGSQAEAGIVLRFQDLRNHLLALYSPELKAIFFFQRRGGSVTEFFTYRIPHWGMVDVPEVGERFTLTAAVCGEYVAMTLDDGQRRYHTPPVKVTNCLEGRIGLWRGAVELPQEYRNLRVSETPFPMPQPDVVQPGVQLMRSGEDVGPSVPSPQDWVLVLERVK